MSNFNTFSKFAHRMTFVNTGLAFASVAMLLPFVSNTRVAPDNAVIDPVLAFAISGVTAVVGVYAATRAGKGYRPIRDGLPLLAFAMACILAGNQRGWAWTLLIVAVLGNTIFLFARKHGDMTEEHDRITFHPRWPF